MGRAPRAMRLNTAFAVGSDGIASGFAFDPDDLQARFVVEILADGLPVALVRAHHHRADLHVGDGCYGFTAPLAATVLARAERLDARLANTGDSVGSIPVPSGVEPPRGPLRGKARWIGGTRVSGWLEALPSDPPPVVKALLEGCEVARATCRAFAHVDEDGVHGIVRAFTLDLPCDLADGRVRTVEVMTEDGMALAGSPCLVFALADGFAGVIDAHAELESERVRARFADGLLPRCVPFSDFTAWRARFPVLPPFATLSSVAATASNVAATVPRVAVLVIGEEGLGDTLDSLDDQAGVDWSAAVLPSTRSRAEFEPRLLEEFLAEAGTADLLVATVGGARFDPGALALFADAARRFPRSQAFYGDAAFAADGQSWPIGYPAYDDELFLERGYCGLCFALRFEAATRAAAVGCGSLYDLFPEPAAGDGAVGRPVHLPTPLVLLPDLSPDALAPALRDATARRLAARGAAAEVTCSPAGRFAAVRVRRRAVRQTVSVLIAGRDGGEALGLTLDALEATAGAALSEVVIADNASTDPVACALLASAEARGHAVLRLRGLFSEAHLLNRAAAVARGDVLLMLRPGAVPQGAGWLEEMLGRCAGEDVGAVGALVAWSDGVVRDAGFVLGPRFSVAHRFRDRHVDDAGYAGWLGVAHEVGAVSASCMMTPRRRFASLRGFDESGATSLHHDVDYCLRLREAGSRIVFTPHARFTCDRRDPVPRDATLVRSAHGREVELLRLRWRLVPGCDAFYSPWMAMDETPYSGLAWPPVPYAPRLPFLSLKQALRP